MAKKDFKKKTPTMEEIMSRINGDTEQAQQTQETQTNNETQSEAPQEQAQAVRGWGDPRFETQPKAQYYRFNLKMPIEYEAYLKKAAYNSSTPLHVVTVTEYINMLIREDMKQHGENI